MPGDLLRQLSATDFGGAPPIKNAAAVLIKVTCIGGMFLQF
jgi:hypothetical protein